MHSTHQPSPSQPVLVRSSLRNPPTGNPPLQSVRVCPTSTSATTVHCAFHLPQSELVLSISTPVNENLFCSPHNRQPDRSQCLWIPWCAFHCVLPFCSFCLLATTPMQSVPVCPTLASKNHNPKYAPPAGHHRVVLSISAPVNKNHCAFHPSAITIAVSAGAFQSVQSTTGNPPLQSVHVCPASASETIDHCAFHLPQADFVLSISTPVNENLFCSPHNRQPDRNQCL